MDYESSNCDSSAYDRWSLPVDAADAMCAKASATLLPQSQSADADADHADEASSRQLRRDRP